MSQLNDIHADIGALQAQMDTVTRHLEKIENICTTVALHDERIKNVKRDVADHENYIQNSKKRQWTFGGIILAGSALVTAFVNGVIKIVP